MSMVQETKTRVRSCIGCGEKNTKTALFRIVRGADGTVAFDGTGRAAGRGAYLCSPTCFSAVRKSRKLEHALRVKLTEEDYERIASELARACGDAAGEIEE